MQLFQRVLFTICVLTILASGLGYDPLARTVAGIAPYTLPCLLLALVILCQSAASTRLVQQQGRAMRHRIEALKHDLQTTAAQIDGLAAETSRLSASLQTVQQNVAEQHSLMPARVLLLQERYEEAAQALQAILECFPASQEGHWLRGEALLGLKRPAEALSHLRTGLVHDDTHRLSVLAQCEQTLGHHADAEQHLLRSMALRETPRSHELVTLGMAQVEVAPERASATFAQALALNPYNSAARYQLMALSMRAERYDEVIALASEGLEHNPADTGCFVCRAEALYRRGHGEDQAAILGDLSLARAKNRRDYNIDRLWGGLHQRQAIEATSPTHRRQALLQAIEAYEQGLAHVPAKFHAHLLAAESRVYLQLQDSKNAVKMAQRAVDHAPSHVSNHLALALAHLADCNWRQAAQAADRGLPWAGWGGRVWLTAITIFAHICAGSEPATLRQSCTSLANALAADTRHFELSETWGVVCDILSAMTDHTTPAGGVLMRDTIALLEHTISPEAYRLTWGTEMEQETREVG
jgi:tetratricopeptide (TPR) repeat protein